MKPETLRARLTKAEELTDGLKGVIKAQKTVINELLDSNVKLDGQVKTLEAELRKQQRQIAGLLAKRGSK